MRDLEYLRGLDNAVAQGVEYAIEVVAGGEERTPIPVALTCQARLAARNRIPLESVFRRYIAGKALVGTLLLEEASRSDIFKPHLLKAITEAHEAAFERLLTEAEDEYQRETRARTTSHETRVIRCTRRLLAGERVDPSILEYDVDGHHLGLVALSANVDPLLRQLAKKIGCRVLTIHPSEMETWVWIGSKDSIDPTGVRSWLKSDWPDSLPLGIGEPSYTRSGWRLSHEQARSAVSFASSQSSAVVWYRSVSLIDFAGRDPLLRASLREMYLRPLANEGSRGNVLRRTLRAYFDTGCNTSAAAAILGINRQTVANHLNRVETILGQPIAACADSLHAALRLEQVELTSA